MKKKIKIILYSNDYKDKLDVLLKEFSLEVFGTGTSDIDSFLNSGLIYLAICDNKVIGFSSFNINTYHGFRSKTISNNYLYIKKEYRRSKAMHLFSIQSVRICIENNTPLEHYYAEGSGSEKFIGRLEGKKEYTAYIYTVEVLKQQLKKLTRKVKVK